MAAGSPRTSGPASASHVPALGQLRWPLLEAPRPRPLLLVPVGSVEQHGPALPLATDTMIAAAVTHEVARCLLEQGQRVVVAPAVGYGASGEHEDFPGTVSIGLEVLQLVLVELARSACRWAEGVILVNAHGGNAVAVRDAVLQLRREDRPVAWTDCHVDGADAHAGRAETSLVRCIAPWAVHVDRLEAGNTAPLAELMPDLRARRMRAVSPNGVLGDPTASSAEEGRRLLAAVVTRVVAELTDIDVADDDGRLVVAGEVALSP